jgi:hypothetical protein
MPRFFFDCRRPTTIARDCEGVVWEDRQAAVRLAHLTIRDFRLASSGRLDPEWRDCQLEVRAGDGTSIAVIPFTPDPQQPPDAVISVTPAAPVAYLALERATRRLKREGKTWQALLNRTSQLLLRGRKTRGELEAQSRRAAQLRSEARQAVERSRESANLNLIPSASAVFRPRGELAGV